MNQPSSDTGAMHARSRPPRTKRHPFLSVRRIMVLILLLVVALIVSASFAPTTRWIYGNGYIMTALEVKIRPSVESIIVKRLVQSNAPVEKNQLLIQLDDSIQRAAYEEAMSRIKAERVDLDRLISLQKLEQSQRQEQITQAKLTLELTRNILNRMVAASSQGGGVSRNDLDQAKLRSDLAASQLSELQLPHEAVMHNQIAAARERIVASGKHLVLLDTEVKRRQIHSPLRGTVHFHRFEPGEVVGLADELGQVFDCDTWIVRLNLPERVIAQVKTEQPVRVALAAYPTMHHGYLEATVCRIDKIVTPRTTGDGVFYVEALLKDRPGVSFKPGMTAWGYVNSGRTTWLKRLLGW